MILSVQGSIGLPGMLGQKVRQKKRSSFSLSLSHKGSLFYRVNRDQKVSKGYQEREDRLGDQAKEANRYEYYCL